MNLTIKMMMEWLELLRQFDIRKLKDRELHQLKIISTELHKWSTYAMQKEEMEIKYRHTLKGLKKMNIIDADTALEIPDLPQEAAIRCHLKGGNIIKREECLDYSGAHLDDCRECDEFSVTRDKLT